jgi:hypothetical protein
VRQCLASSNHKKCVVRNIMKYVTTMLANGTVQESSGSTRLKMDQKLHRNIFSICNEQVWSPLIQRCALL